MRKILKGAVVLLIVAAMFFSTSAVNANTLDTPQIQGGGQNSPQPFIQTNPPTTTRALLWDNGNPDLVNAWCCQRIGIVVWSDVADDFHLDKKCTIEKVEWETVDTTDYNWGGTDDLIIYEYTPAGPGTELIVLLEVQNTREQIGEQWSKPWYRYEIDLKGQGKQFNLQAGDYYILLRPYTSGNTGQSFWMTSPPPAGSTSETYFRSEYFGYPNWVAGSGPFGYPYDVSFKIYGTKDSSREINRPILDFLHNHPNMFPILQLLLQRLGL